jgi:ketosteroid isomerase-like protein
LVRQGCEAANRRDFDLLFLVLDPEIEFRFAGGLIPPDLLGWHRGHAGYRRIWAAGLEAWEDLRLEHEEVIDFGDRVLVCGRQVGHGTASGVLVSQPLFQVFTLRRGLVIRQEDFADRDEALEAVELSE